MRKGWLAGIAGGVAAALVAAFLLTSGQTPPPPAEPPPTAATPTPATTPTPAPTPAREAAAPAAPAGFAYQRYEVDSKGERAELCLVFSALLAREGVDYGPFVAASGRPLAIRIDGRRLCLGGVPFGETIRITLRPGLPAADGATLAEAVTLDAGLGDRPASVAFGNGAILPAASLDGIPVTTVNVPELVVEVYRLSDRQLIGQWWNFMGERSFSPWEIRDLAADRGRKVWSGTLPVQAEPNAAAVSLVPVAQAVDAARPGVYLLTARPAGPAAAAAAEAAAPESEDEDIDYNAPPLAGQWFIRTDIGLTAFRGADGLTLFARSLGGAKPLAGVEMVLYSRGNEELARATTDADGRARLPAGALRGSGGAAPAAVMAYGAEDFTYLDLRRGAFDLSDRGVDGRPPAAATDAFVYTERGIYRPGESVRLIALMRDAVGAALPGRAAVVRLIRPDGREARRWRLDDAGGGALALDIPIPAAAQRGVWQASVHADPGGPAVGQASFEVQDFVPRKLAVDLAPPPPFLRPGDEIRLGVDARFLYGAPGADLDGGGEVWLSRDDKPFPAFADFVFEPVHQRLDGARLDLTLAPTDAAGHSEAVAVLDLPAEARRPMTARVNVWINEPGGRATDAEVSIPVRPLETYIGVRSRHRDGVPDGAEAAFEVVAVDAAGSPVARDGLRWTVVREGGSWQWFRRGGAWTYEYIPRDAQAAAGTLAVGAGAPANLAMRLDWGRYRLEVADPATGNLSAIRFAVGYYGAALDTRPDRLEVATGRAGYAPGDTASLRIDSAEGGEALVVIANESVHHTRLVSIPPGGGEVSIPVAAEWGAGAYALVTLYRPLSGPEAAGRGPVRAVGVAWLGLDPAAHTIPVSLAAPPAMTPRQSLRVPLRLGGVSAAGQAFVTLAAVDEGILSLTRHPTPDPAGWYLGKRRLGVDMLDDYGRLIQGPPRGGQGEGGDAMGGAGLDVVPTRTVALFSGVVPVAADGTADITLEVPDFQGELRLMAVAWDGRRTGAAEARVTVRDPVVAEVILPRFLAPGDIAQATVLVHNVAGQPGAYTVAVRGRDAVAVADAAGRRTIDLPAGRRETWTVPLTGPAAGIGTVELAVEGPGFAVTRAWPIQVRPGALPVTREQVSVLKPGADLVVDGALLAGFLPGSTSAAVSLSRWQRLDVPGLLRWLDRYPFGCLEQTVSRALPLLYFNDLALLAGGADDAGAEGRVQAAIDRLETMQTAGGDFRMWGAWGEVADPWLSVFALDFLHRAAAKGYAVQDGTLRDGRRWLAAALGNEAQSVRAYAGWVLAVQGQANVSDLRYLHDSALPAHAVARAQLGAALEAAGDRARAADAFAKARAVLGQKADGAPPYGSALRDTFAVVSALAAAGRGEEVAPLLTRVRGLRQGADATTTQEKAWMLLAAAELARGGGPLAVERDGQPLPPAADPLLVALDPAALATSPVRLRNSGSADLFPVVSVSGVPDGPQAAADDGVAVRRSFLTLAGAPADLATLRRNDRLLMVIEGKATAGVRDTYALLALLPAGLEIEAIVEPEAAGYGWLEPLTWPQMKEARDDRLAAALALPRWDGNTDLAAWAKGPAEMSFRMAAVLRAVTPGDFVLPAVRVEAMYDPAVSGGTASGRLAIAE